MLMHDLIETMKIMNDDRRESSNKLLKRLLSRV